MAAFLAAFSQLHVQPGIACSTCSLSSGAPARPSIDIVDEASEATARGLEVDQLRPACVAAGANAGATHHGGPGTHQALEWPIRSGV